MINISSNYLKTQNRSKYDVINGNELVNHFLIYYFKNKIIYTQNNS